MEKFRGTNLRSICGQNLTEQNAKAHKEEECTSDWRNPEKIQIESRGRTAHSANHKLERRGGFAFFRFSQRCLLIYTVSTLWILEAVMNRKHLWVYS
jgi:hypothetical protein